MVDLVIGHFEIEFNVMSLTVPESLILEPISFVSAELRGRRGSEECYGQ